MTRVLKAGQVRGKQRTDVTALKRDEKASDEKPSAIYGHMYEFYPEASLKTSPRFAFINLTVSQRRCWCPGKGERKGSGILGILALHYSRRDICGQGKSSVS